MLTVVAQPDHNTTYRLSTHLQVHVNLQAQLVSGLLLLLLVPT